MTQRFGKNVVIYAAADFFARGTQLFALPIYTALLSVEQFGQLSLLTVSASLLAMLINLGVNNAVQRYYFESEKNGISHAKIVSTGLIQLILSGILFCSLFILTFIIVDPGNVAIFNIDPKLFLLAFLYIIPDQIAQYIQDVLRLQFKPVTFFYIAIVRSFLGVLVGLWLLMGWSMGVEGVLIGTLVGSVLAVPLGIFAIRKDLIFEFDMPIARDLLKFGSPFVLVGASYWIFQSMDRWMLANLSGMEEVGIFTVANKFAVIISFATFAFNRAWAPHAFYLHANDGNYKNTITKVFSLWFFLISLTSLAISLFGGEILVIFTPKEYWDAAPILSIMCAAMALDGTTIFTLLGISLEKRTFLMNYGTWIAALVNIALNFLLLPSYGALGAALAALSAYGALTGYFLWMSQRLHPLPLEWRKLSYALALVVCAALAPFALSIFGSGIFAHSIKIGFLGLAIAVGVGLGIINSGIVRQLTQKN